MFIESTPNAHSLRDGSNKHAALCAKRSGAERCQRQPFSHHRLIRAHLKTSSLGVASKQRTKQAGIVVC